VAADHESQGEARTPQQCLGRNQIYRKEYPGTRNSAIDQCGDFWCGDKRPDAKWLKPMPLLDEITILLKVLCRSVLH
jgi:hypothetical protein